VQPVQNVPDKQGLVQKVPEGGRVRACALVLPGAYPAVVAAFWAAQDAR